MRLAAGEVEQRRAELGRLHHAEIDLQATARDHAGLGVAADEDAIDEAQADQRLHDGPRIVGGDDHVDVADGLAEAPQAPAVLGVGDAGDGGEPRDDALGHGQRHRDGRARPAPLAGHALQRVRELLLGLLAEAAQRAEAVLGHGAAQIFESEHAQLVTQARHVLGAEAGDLEERDHARGVLGAELVELLHPAGVDELADLGGGRLADALQRHQLRRAERRRVAGEDLDGARRALVGADAERLHVALVQGGELDELVEHVEDVLFPVCHGASVPRPEPGGGQAAPAARKPASGGDDAPARDEGRGLRR